MKTTRDPIAIVYDAIWAKLEADRQLRALVSYRKRTQWTDRDRADDAEDDTSGGELARLSLDFTGGALAPWATSDTAEMVMNFRLAVSTNKSRIDAELTPILWAILRAISSTTENLGLSFVNVVRLGEFSVGEKMIDSADPGWIMSLPIVVETKFERATLALSEYSLETEP